MKNWLLLKLTRWLQRWIKQSPLPERFLIVTTTALGDTLWATPSIESLRRSFPKAYIGVLTSKVGKEVLRHNPWIDALYVLVEPMLPRVFTLWKTLYKERFETVIVLHASQRLILPLSSLLGAKRIVATYGLQKGLDQLLTDGCPAQKEHEIIRRLRLIEQVGGKRSSEALSFFLQPEEKLPAAKKRFIILHPGAQDSFRRWPAKCFAHLGQKLQALGLDILVTGSAKEEPLLDEVCREFPSAIKEISSSLRSFAALVEKASLLITNDTGPAHLACALNLPLIALYPCSDPNLFGPHLAKEAISIVKRPTCDPCLKRKCRRPFCQLQITPEEVFTEAKKLLKIS